MTKRSKAELYERIRRSSEFDGLSISALARHFGVHRRTVRRASLEFPHLRPLPEEPFKVGQPLRLRVDQKRAGSVRASASIRCAFDLMTFRTHIIETGTDRLRPRATRRSKGT
jgi:hypothetical protein